MTVPHNVITECIIADPFVIRTFQFCQIVMFSNKVSSVVAIYICWETTSQYHSREYTAKKINVNTARHFKVYCSSSQTCKIAHFPFWTALLEFNYGTAQILLSQLLSTASSWSPFKGESLQYHHCLNRTYCSLRRGEHLLLERLPSSHYSGKQEQFLVL